MFKSVAYAAGVLALFVLAGCSSGMGSLAGAKVASASLAPQPSARSAIEALGGETADAAVASAYVAGGNPGLNDLISHYAAINGIPASLIHRVIDRESDYNVRARNGPYYGLMQISHATAKSMGYRGSAEGLLDAETNLRYATKYLAGAYLVGGHSQDQAIRNYSRGYYYDAKAKGLLEEVGLR